MPDFLTTFAIADFLGPLLLGRPFDTVGRKPMIAGSYFGSAAVGDVRHPGARLVLRRGLDAVERCAVGPCSLCRTFAHLRLMNELRRHLRASHTEDRPEARRRRDRTTRGGLLRSLRSGELRGW
ncbi:hypothetical protein ACFQ9Z_17800 [Streptomyces sp. NPDC056580]|uniref:hypothetical protein n=1 Tax=Streptomyces sp. NPDC056580 TaxID=3345872 RepID=UPI0036C4D407